MSTVQKTNWTNSSYFLLMQWRDGYSNVLRNHLDLIVEGYLQELPLLVEGESGAAVPLVELSCRGRYLLKSKMFCELHLCN